MLELALSAFSREIRRKIIRTRSIAGLDVIGSGFIVRPGLVMTAAHVVNELFQKIRKKRIPADWRFLQFLYPSPSERAWQQIFQAVAGEGEVSRPRRQAKSGEVKIITPKLDIGVLEFQPTDQHVYRTCLPLPTGAADSIQVGTAVGVCGYPYGEKMLLQGEGVYRFGPAIQQGYISAVAPIDAPGVRIQRILLDVRTARGMSGGPVFLAETGEVIGVLTAGTAEDRYSVTSFATPLSTEALPRMLDAIDEASARVRHGAP